MDPVAAGADIVGRRAAAPGVDHVVARRAGDHVLDKGTREAQPTVLVEPAALGQGEFQQLLGRIADAEGLQKLERTLVDALNVAVLQRPVGATLQAGPNRLVAGA